MAFSKSCFALLKPRDDDGAVTSQQTGEAGGRSDGEITRVFQDFLQDVEVITLLIRSLLLSSRRAKSGGFREEIRELNGIRKKSNYIPMSVCVCLKTAHTIHHTSGSRSHQHCLCNLTHLRSYIQRLGRIAAGLSIDSLPAAHCIRIVRNPQETEKLSSGGAGNAPPSKKKVHF